MSIKDTIEAIRKLPLNQPLYLDGDDGAAYVSALTVADLQELVNEYEKLRRASKLGLRSLITSSECPTRAESELREVLDLELPEMTEGQQNWSITNG
jgi:hypothetical protein